MMHTPPDPISFKPLACVKAVIKSGFKTVLLFSVVMLLLLVAAIAALRFWLLPDMTVLQPEIEAFLSIQLKQPVRLQGLKAQWDWASAELQLAELQVGIPNAPTLLASGVRTTVPIYPLLLGRVSTQRLSINQLTLLAQQTGTVIQPHWLVGGVDTNQASDGTARRWLLQQPNISVAGLRIKVEDITKKYVPEGVVQLDFNELVLMQSALNHDFKIRFAPEMNDPRLGKGAIFTSRFNHALLGDIANVKQWTGQAQLDLPGLYISNTMAWLLKLYANSTQSQSWQQWAQHSQPTAILNSQTTVQFKAGKMEAFGKAHFTHLTNLSHKPNEIIDVVQPIEWRWENKGKQQLATLRSNGVALAPLATLLASMPLPKALLQILSDAKPQGELKGVVANAEFTDNILNNLKLNTEVQALGLQGFDWEGAKGLVNIPTVQGISGVLKLEHSLALSQAQFKLNSRNTRLELPRVLAEPVVNFTGLTGDIDFKLSPKNIALSLNKVRFSNHDLEAELTGKYTVSTKQTAQDNTLGLAHFTGELARVDLAQLHRYLPLTLSDNGRVWLRHTLAKGQASHLAMVLKGDLSRFPFLPEVAQAGERFDLQGYVKDAELNFNPPPNALINTENSATPSPLYPHLAEIKHKQWPVIHSVSGSIGLHGLSLTLDEMVGKISSDSVEVIAAHIEPVSNNLNTAAQVVASSLPPLNLRVPHLTIASLTQPVVVLDVNATAPASSVLELVRNTPLSSHLGEQFAALKTQGNVNVDAHLSLDIAHPERNLVQGTLALTDVSLSLNTDLPPIEHLNATAEFKQTGFTVKQANAQWLGGDVGFSGSFDTQDSHQILRLKGRAQLANIKQYSPHSMAQALLSHAQGAVSYGLDLSASPQGIRWQVDADLKEAALAWPGILNKALGMPLPFTLTRTPTQRSSFATGKVIDRDVWEASLGATVLGPFKARIERQLQGDDWLIKRGAVALGEEAQLNTPDSGVGVHITGKTVNLDQLQTELAALPWKTLPTATLSELNIPSELTAKNVAPPPWMPSVIAVQVDDLTMGHRRYTSIIAGASRSGERGENWHGNLIAKGINGYFSWADPSLAKGLGRGQLQLRLSELTVPEAELVNNKQALLELSPEQVPSVDLTIDKLTLGKTFLGSIALKAKNINAVNMTEPPAQIQQRRMGWDIETLNIQRPHLQLQGKGLWKQSTEYPIGHVALDFSLKTDSFGDTLADLDHDKVIAGAAGELKGNVAWRGTPFGFDIANLSGKITGRFEKGRFLKIDPGAGRVVGLFSLQNLPRRLTLDFKDTFGEGFAFDNVVVAANVQNGQLALDNFVMNSAVAKVTATGGISLTAETQALRFKVKPEINAGSASLLYMLINPVVGLSTLAAQWLFKEPLSDSLTMMYDITGSWAKPEVNPVKRKAGE